MLAYFGVLALLLVAWLVTFVQAASRYGDGDNLIASFWFLLMVAVTGILIWFAVSEGDYDLEPETCRSAGNTWIEEQGCYDLRHVPKISSDKVLTPNENHVK